MFMHYSGRNKTSGCSYRRALRPLRGSWRKYCGEKTHRCWEHFGQSLETERQCEPHMPHGAYVPRAGLRPRCCQARSRRGPHLPCVCRL